jgi:hypothetical protein
MPRCKFSLTDLNQLRHQLDSWRQSQSPRTRLPEALWKSAATLVSTHGVGCVARTLRLDYSKLKRRLTEAPGISAQPNPPPAFVEVQLDDGFRSASRLCRIELSDPTGGKMTVDLPSDAPAVLGLAQAFWRRG